MKVALATCMKLPEPDADEALLVSALEAEGATVRLLAWDAASNGAERDELVVIRSTWNYCQNIDRFLAWIERIDGSTRLLNPAAIVRANARKTYLRELAARGIAVVPTEYVTRRPNADESRPPHRQEWSIAELLERRGWEAIVIKPVVSAGSVLTRRFGAAEAEDAQRFLDGLTEHHDAMIQRWMPLVDTYGERSLVWIDGELSHAVRKSPRFSGDAESVSTEVAIAPHERAFAEKLLEPMKNELLYARVDVVPDEDGVLRLMELELIEPSLFLRQCPRALDRLARAIVRASQDMA